MKINLLSKFCLAIAFIVPALSWHVSAQTPIDEAWTSFLNNDVSKAKQQFSNLLKSPKTKEQALLGLALSSTYDADSKKAFAYINEFYETSTNPAPYIYALWSTPVLNSSSRKTPEEIAFFEKLAQRADIDGSLRAMAESALGNHYQYRKKSAEAAAAFLRIGSLENWQVLGEFENISTSGFDKNYAALDNPSDEAVFTDKRGAKVKWFSPPYYRRDKWVDFTNYFSATEAIVFAQTFVESDKEQEIQLRAGVSGSMKVWVNDFLVISEEEERNNDLDNYIRVVKLNKGFNRILVQVGESYAGRSNFMIRLTDSSGTPIPGLKGVAAYQPYTKASAYEVKTVPLFAEKFFEEAASQAKVHSMLLQAICYLRNDKTFETRNILENIKLKYPQSTYLHSLFIDLYRRTQNRTGSETAKEAIKTYDPEHPQALDYFIGSYFERGEYLKAEEYLKKLEALYGENHKTILLYKITLLLKKNEADKAVPLAEKAYDMYPDDPQFTEYKYVIEKEVKKSNENAINILNKYLENNDDYSASKYLSNLYIGQGDFDKGIEVLKEESRLDPVAVGVYLDIVRNYYQAQKYQEAKQYEEKAIEVAPYVSTYFVDMANINNSLNKKDEAAKAYNKALELNPNNYSAIRELRELENKKPLFDYFAQPDINKIIASAPSAEAYPEDESIVLHQEVQTIIHKMGGSEEKHILVVKVFNSSGVESWKEYTIAASGWQRYIIDQAEVVKTNGQKTPAEVNYQDLVFTNLEPGDAIHITYRLENYSQGQLANKFWDSFYFSHSLPYVKTKYSLLVAKNQPFKYQFSQKEIKPVKKTIEDFELYIFEDQNQPALVYEDKMPAFSDVANVLHMSTIPDWKYVSTWYLDMASAKARPNYEVKETIKSLFKNKAQLSDLEKAKMIYNYITKNINYSSVSFRQSGLVPQEPAAVLNTKIGDCKDVSTLFVAMCKEAGLNANLVLVNTRENGQKDMILPSINFNHCIARLNLPGKQYYLELTSTYLPFGAISNNSLQSAILNIEPNGNPALSLLSPDNRSMNEIERTVNIKTQEANLVIHEDNCKVGTMAAYTRQGYAELSDKDKSKTMQEALKSAMPNAELNELSFRNLPNSENRDSLFTSISYTLTDDIKSIGGIQIISVPWSNKALASDISISGERKFPIDFTSVYNIDRETETVTLQLPEGKSVIEVIPSVKYSNDYIDYSLDVKTEGDKLIMKRSFIVKENIIPVSAVPEFMETYKKIAVADSKQIAVK